MQSDLQKIVTPEVQKFVHEHEADDVSALVLKHSELFGLPAATVADQISGRRKAKEKIPAYYSTSNIIYPPSVNVEQSSSQRTAEFKLQLIKGNITSNHTAVDLTAGLGIDSWWLSRHFDSVDVVDQNDYLLSITRHNHNALGIQNIKYHLADASDFIRNTSAVFDLVFVDPSRRTTGNQRVFKLSDCSPDIVELQQEIFSKSNYLLVKVSPMLDIDTGLRELKFVKSVTVVSVDDECKEVLFFSEKDFVGRPEIITVNLKNEDEVFSFYSDEERQATITMNDPLEYLYEPNASILKAGAFKSIGSRFGFNKIHPSTHLYTSNRLVPEFPGRIFKIEAFVKSDPKAILPYFPNEKGNVAVRNYPLSAVELRKKSGLSDGGEKYLLGFSGQHKKFLVVVNRIK